MKYFQIFRICILGFEFSWEVDLRGPYWGLRRLGDWRYCLNLWWFGFRFEFYGPGIY